MKKIIIALLLFVVTGCSNKHFNKGTAILQEHGNLIMTISSGDKSCVPVKLALYDDNQYELFTDHKACKSNQECEDMIEYTKSIKGTYDFDPIKIIEENNIEINETHSMDNLPKYEIYVGDIYVQKGYEYYYSVKNGTKNKSLDDLLNKLEIDLDVCANKNYINY